MQFPKQHPLELTKRFLPALVSGGIAWLVFMIIGQTPIVRATGLALVVVGVALGLRRMGAILSLGGGLTLAFSPTFWLQTGGGDAGPATIVIAIGAAIVTVPIVIAMSRRPYIGIGLGVITFVFLFWSQVGTPRSLRLTSLVTAWLMSILVDMLLLTNPRPNEAKPETPRPYHTLGILLLLSIGILNDPLLILLVPMVVLSLFLSTQRFPNWYWFALLVATGIGIRGLFFSYQATLFPYIDWLGWRDATRWVEVVRIIIDQYSIVGILLGVLGLARLSRWYPTLGTMTMTGYAAYVFLGLIYSGPDRDILLLPLLIIQVIWMTYAVFTVNQWAMKSFQNKRIHWVAPMIYLLLPLILLMNLFRTPMML